MDTERIITNFYDGKNEDERFSSKHAAVEFIVTRKYIDRYLREGDRLLEVGCGTGRYSLHYARLGYEIDALELVQSNLDVLHQNALPGDKIRAVQGTALNLSAYEDNTFDLTLVLGPMYHLFTDIDKRKCLSEAVRVTRQGGVVFVAYCQFDASMIQAGFIRGMYDFLIENDLLDEEAFLPISNPKGIFELHRKEQIDELNEGLPVKRLHYVGVDMFSHYMREALNGMDDRLFGKYIDYTMTICENAGLVGLSNHALDVLRKL